MIVFSLSSLLVANQGLTQLISLSVPVLVGLYPLAIVLIRPEPVRPALGVGPRVFVPVMIVALLFGIVDGLGAAKLNGWVPDVFGFRSPIRALAGCCRYPLRWSWQSFPDRLLGKPREAVA